MPYAKGSGVSVEKSEAEIKRMIVKFGATRVGTQWDQERAIIGFEARGWRVRFTIKLPPVTDFLKSEKGYTRDAKAQALAREAETRRRWRSLALVIKAKIEAVESDVSTFQDEFLAFLIMANGDTVGDWIGPQMKTMQAGKMPPLLPKGSS